MAKKRSLAGKLSVEQDTLRRVTYQMLWSACPSSITNQLGRCSSSRIFLDCRII